MTEEEAERLKEMVAVMPDRDVSTLLEGMAIRELHLLDSPTFSSGELRDLTLRNAAALSAAAERLSVTQVQTERQESGTSSDPLEDPSPQRE